MYDSPSGNKSQKHVIEKDMYNHHARVLSSKPIIQITPPHQHVDHNLNKLACPRGNLFI